MKRGQTEAQDDFAAICLDAAAGVNMNGIISKHNRTCSEFEFDFDCLDLRWQICYALKFLRTNGWTLKNQTKNSISSYGWKHIVEDQAKETNEGFYVCNGAMIVACRLAQIPEKPIHQCLNTMFALGSNLDIENPHLQRFGPNWTGEWKTKQAKKYASVALTCSMDEHLANALLSLVAEYLNVPFNAPPAFRNRALRCYHALKHLAPQNQHTLM